MTDESRRVPKGRVQRLGRFARLAGGVAGSVLAEGVRQVSSGNRPRARDLVLTPANAKRLTRQLSEMRGAAMKLGQILSMDSGDLLPKELTDILANLRNSAFAMPPEQLNEMLIESFGEQWQQKLKGFESKPFAAASIGQVHRLQTRNGRAAVIKIQYPGVRESIESDVDNLASLLRFTGLLPRHIDIAPILKQVKAQLKEEADYEQEARYLNAFVRALGDDERFVLPRQIPSLSTDRVLGMTYVPGVAIESVIDQPQEERDRVLSLLFELLFVEMFDLRLVQTDPNFANYQYEPDTGQVILLDFGASRRFKAAFTHAYKDILRAVIADDRAALAVAAERAGYQIGAEGGRYREVVLDLAQAVLKPILQDAPYHFSASTIPQETSAIAAEMRDMRQFWEAPPVDAAYIHRKLAGLFLLAARVKVRVNVRQLLEPWLES